MKHIFDYNYDHYMEMLTWLDKNVQENCQPDMHRYASSSVSRFVEWRSKDYKSWILRVFGMPPKVSVEIEDPNMEMLFLLKWQ